MAFFTRLFGDGRLYVGPTGTGQLLLVLPSPCAKDDLELDEAWSSTTLLANVVYAAGDPGITADTANTFVSAILQLVASSGVARGFVWLRAPTAWTKSALTGDTAPMMGMNEDATALQTGLSGPILPGVVLSVANGATLARAGTLVTIGGDVSFTGDHAPEAMSPAAAARLPLDGDLRGTLAFLIYLERHSLNDSATWGFQLLFPAPPESAQPAIYEWLPFASSQPPNDALGFRVTIDPSDPTNQVVGNDGARGLRSLLAFTGTNADSRETTLASSYRTTYGATVELVPVAGGDATHPAALVWNGGTPTSDSDEVIQLAPMGDFILSLPGSTDPVATLLCGLHGTESIGFQPRGAEYAGDRLRFTPYQPAYAPRYPFGDVSPVGPPVDVNAPLLDDTYTTSWATVVRAPEATGAIAYVAQPKGAPLYGHDPVIWAQGTDLMGWMDPAATLPTGVPFPIVPYAGSLPASTELTFTAAQAADFERQVVGPTRRRLIGGGGARSSSVRAALGHEPGGGDALNTTTPSGLLATLEGGTWTRILLGQHTTPPRKMYFARPDDTLQQAFQTGQLFLVAADARHLGEFHNTMEIGGWNLAANVGAGNSYGDYRNVMIVKGRKGKLRDLVSNPERWTQKEAFADAKELVALSQWLKSYFDDAAAQPDQAYFATFNRIVEDEAWTGILILRMDIARVPDDLAGIVAGVTDRSRFNAHHFAIEISQVKNGTPPPGEPPGPFLDGASSMFGLIYYVDPAFTPPAGDEEPRPILDASGATYAFRLLTLKVLFENSAVKKFQSYAQLTLNQFFGTPVARMGEGGNLFNALVLRGTFQNNNGVAVYSLSSASGASFYLDHDLLTKVEITTATMSTRSAATTVVSWFGLTGFLDLATVKVTPGGGDPPYDFDLFSFGSGATDATRRGLSFAGLGLTMSFAQDTPDDRAFVFATNEIRFDLATSTPRPGSLFRQFALDLQGLVAGSKDRAPRDLGYLDVITDARLSGVGGDDGWYGLRYRLNLGTPGKLAGKVGLDAYLITAWSPKRAAEGSYAAMIGLELPGSSGGAPLLSLQTVLKLSIGPIRMTLDRSATPNAFLMLFTELALKFFGLLSIPPSGSTLFYLFGNPQASGEPSGLGWYAMYRNPPPTGS